MSTFYRTVKAKDWPWIAKQHPGASVSRRDAPKGKLWVRFVGDNPPVILPLVSVQIYVPSDARQICDKIAGKRPSVVRLVGDRVVLSYRVDQAKAQALQLL